MAGNASGIKAGRAYVELGVKDDLAKGLAKARESLKALGDGIKAAGMTGLAVGGGIVGGLLGAAKVFADAGSEALDMSRRTGVAVEALQELGYAAAQDGVDIGTLEGGLLKMEKAVSAALGGNKAMQETFEDLGFSMESLQDKAPDELFKMLGDKVSRIADPTQRAAMAMKVFGKSGASLLPMLKQGAAGLEAMAKEARAYGMVMTPEEAEQAHALGDSWTLLEKSAKALVVAIGSSLAPMLTDLSIGVSNVIAGVTSWVRENKDLIVTVFKWGAVIAGVGAALVVLGTAIVGVGAVLGALVSIGGTVMAVVGAFGTILGALISPFGIVIGVAIAAGAALIDFGSVAKSVAGYAGEQFTGIQEDASTAFEGIKDSLASGDIEGAAMILWQGLKTLWTRFTTEISKLWTNWVYDLAGAFSVIESEVLGVWDRITTTIADGITGVAHALGVDSLVLGVSLTDEEVAQAGDQLKKQQEQRDKERADALAKQIASLEAGRQAEIDAADKELADAREKLKTAVDDAKKRRKDKEASAQKLPDTPENQFSLLLPSDFQQGVMQSIASARISSTGTFNADAVLGLQASSSPLQQVAKATEATARNTGRLVEMAQGGGLTFEE